MKKMKESHLRWYEQVQMRVSMHQLKEQVVQVEGIKKGRKRQK